VEFILKNIISINNISKNSQMSATIVKPNTLDTSLVQFGEVITNAKGGKSIKVEYNDERKFLIRTPEMAVAFDLVVEESKDLAPGVKSIPKYSFQISFKGMDAQDANGQAISNFHTMINDLDSLLVEKGIENSLTWLKMKNAQPVVVEALLNHTIKQSKDKATQEPDGKYPDTMRVRVPVSKEGKLMCSFFNKEGSEVNDIEVLQKLKRGARVSMILECAGVYFASGKFGYTSWQVYQCRIKQEPSSYGVPRGKCLITDSDDDTADLAPVAPKSATVLPVAAKKQPPAQIEHDNEVDDSNDDELPPPPVVEVKEDSKKKVTVRRVPAVATKK